MAKSKQQLINLENLSRDNMNQQNERATAFYELADYVESYKCILQADKYKKDMSYYQTLVNN